MKTFDRKQTNWEGLWWQSDCHYFKSAVFNLSELKQFEGAVRIYVRKNRFFNNGENNRPNYCFCIRDANSEISHELEILELEDEISEDKDFFTDDDGNRLYTEEEVYKVIHGMEIDYGLSYGNNLIEDYIWE